MLSPDSVSRVTPPTTMIPRTRVEERRSHLATAGVGRTGGISSAPSFGLLVIACSKRNFGTKKLECELFRELKTPLPKDADGFRLVDDSERIGVHGVCTTAALATDDALEQDILRARTDEGRNTALLNAPNSI